MNPKSQVQRDKCREREIQKLHDQNGKFLLMMKKLKSSAQVKHTCTLLNLVIHLRTPISTRAHYAPFSEFFGYKGKAKELRRTMSY